MYKNCMSELLEYPFALFMSYYTWIPALYDESSPSWGPFIGRIIIPCPIMIIHARGDKKIPIRLGQKLYQAAVSGGNKNVQFFEFDDSFEHRWDFSSLSFNVTCSSVQFVAPSTPPQSCPNMSMSSQKILRCGNSAGLPHHWDGPLRNSLMRKIIETISLIRSLW